MELLKLFFGYALMSAAWNVSGGDINFFTIRVFVWLIGLNMILSVFVMGRTGRIY